MAFNINYDRGVMKQIDKVTGVAVYMYVNDPGRYLNAHGTEVSESLAKAAGYDVTTLAKKRLMKQKMAAAMKAIQAEVELADHDQGPEKQVKAEKDGFKVVDLGVGRFQVEDPDGGVLNSVPLPEPQAMILLQQLTGGAAAEEKKTGGAPTGVVKKA